MDWNKVSYIIVLLNVFRSTHAYFESCNQTISIAPLQTISVQSPGFSAGYAYAPGSSCLYTIVAPSGYQIKASCNINMYDPSNKDCTSERFYTATDGKQDLSTSSYWCGSRTVAVTSQGTRLVLAYISYMYSGVFDCSVTTVVNPSSASCDCGWSINSRIVGGMVATTNEYPPMAALVSATGPKPKVYCGATIVSPTMVVTAAHCLRVTTVANTVVSVGDQNMTSGADTIYARVLLVKRFIEHPLYSNVTNLNDIGLVETQTTILWNMAVGPVCLPFYYTSASFAGNVATATGWGSTSFGGPSSDVLLKVNLNLLSNTDTNCTKAYPNVASSQMCSLTPSKDTCQYDSGGPLFYRGPADNRLFLVGLVSLGDGCAGNNPALNTRLTSFLSWIESVIGTGVLCRRVIMA